MPMVAPYPLLLEEMWEVKHMGLPAGGGEAKFEVGGDMTRGGGAAPRGGGGTDGGRWPAAGGGPAPIGGDWLGKGELMAVEAAGVRVRDGVVLAKPSGKSFQAGRLVAVV